MEPLGRHPLATQPLALLADIHGNLPALEAALDAIEQQTGAAYPAGRLMRLQVLQDLPGLQQAILVGVQTLMVLGFIAIFEHASRHAVGRGASS